jgi:hypothetical protein
MINIKRPAKSPASLESDAVKDYLEQLTAWQNEPTLTKPEPTASYRNSDLIEALDDCFFAKCYLTEKKFVSTYEMDIEHFKPKNEFPELRYTWSNLYPADHDANMAKPNKLPEGGYLDPCDARDDVENDMRYWLDFRGQTCHFEAKNTTNQKAVNTAQLLDRIHNGHDTTSKLKTAGLRKALFDKRDEVYKTILAWKNAQLKNDTDETWRNERRLKQLLSRQSSFTMLIRSTSAVMQYVPTSFLD